MSCALWRLHESIERNDPNQLFLLSDEPEIRSVALKLNIIVRSCREVGGHVASKTSKTGLDTFGDLEREFGVQQKTAICPTQEIEEGNGENNAADNASEDLLKDEDAMNHSVSSVGTANTEASSIVHELGFKKQTSEHEEDKPLVNGGRGVDKVKEQDVMAQTAAALAAENVSKMPVKSVQSVKSLVDRIMQEDSQKHLDGSVNGFGLDGVTSQRSLTDQPAAEQSAMRSPPNTPLPQPQGVEPAQCVQEVQTISDTSSPKQIATPSTPIPQAAQEPEDSDEEVVVFIPQPKRLSAQQKPTQQSSRPSTPKEQFQQKPTGQIPQKSLAKTQAKGQASRHSPNLSVVSHAHPQPAKPPTVIDPDAFGRDFRVNLNPSPRLSQNLNGHSSHRIRGNMQNTQVGQIPRNSPRQPTRTSPPRNAPQEDFRRLTPVSGPAPKASNHRRQASRTSPRGGLAPKTGEVMLANNESRAPKAAVRSTSKLPESQVVESSDFVPATPTVIPGWYSYESKDFVPRSALPNAELKSDAPQPRVYEASDFVPRPSRPVRESKPRAPRPRVFEAAEFVPRDFVPRAQPKQHSPEPESIEPRPSINDVDYVLKSGSTRASARGRGRLWTPS